METREKTFKYIDLFSGCGGLSLGLETQGGDLLLAVERSPMAAETFFHNLVRPIESPSQWTEHLEGDLKAQFEARLVVTELGNLLARNDLVGQLASEEPDVIVGGPPCQGFSLAGRRNPEDSRNQLPWQFLSLVERTKPKMVVIENVVGMRHKFSSDQPESVFDQLRQALHETGAGYEVQAVEVNALHYGAPQHRPRLMLIGLRSDLANHLQLKATSDLWRSGFKDEISTIPPLAPRPTIASSEARTVRDAVADLTGEQNPERNGLSNSFLNLMADPGQWAVTTKPSDKLRNHVVRNHQEHAKIRFRLYQALENNGISPRTLSKVADMSEPEARLFLNETLASIHLPLVSPDGETIGETLEQVVDACWRSKTKKHSQKVLNWDKPSKTVVTIGDDYVHPSEPRTFTVRELARFQGFPDVFEFRAKETTGGLNRRNEVPQYSQVGNAVSPFLALAVGELINRTLNFEPKNAQ